MALALVGHVFLLFDGRAAFAVDPALADARGARGARSRHRRGGALHPPGGTARRGARPLAGHPDRMDDGVRGGAVANHRDGGRSQCRRDGARVVGARREPHRGPGRCATASTWPPRSPWRSDSCCSSRCRSAPARREPPRSWRSSSCFLVCLLALAAAGTGTELAIAAAGLTWAATWIWQAPHAGPGGWPSVMTLATPIYLVFLAYPLSLASASDAGLSRTLPPFWPARRSSTWPASA